jgi:UDP-N-acetylglucosamine diphosphorylase / glucose-1-phosphate thymidylyltransferase / UDP-N-acetylgalactosamine diphosphorylase / glucosamine-1-phosphate N-acetyltransferase / galactosamine-1-phosphate N-acetyltransferase
MMDARFSPAQLFNLSSFPFKEIFDGVANVWDVLPKINQFTGGKLIQGKDCYIHPNVNIREGVILGDNVHIGFSVELKNCIILSNTHVAHINYIGDAIVGNNCNVSGGAMFANFRLDNKLVTVKAGEERIETGLPKFSAAIGDGTWIGVNSVLNPGTVLGKNCQVYPLTSVVGYYAEAQVVK